MADTSTNGCGLRLILQRAFPQVSSNIIEAILIASSGNPDRTYDALQFLTDHDDSGTSNSTGSARLSRTLETRRTYQESMFAVIEETKLEKKPKIERSLAEPVKETETAAEKISRRVSTRVGQFFKPKPEVHTLAMVHENPSNMHDYTLRPLQDPASKAAV